LEVPTRRCGERVIEKTVKNKHTFVVHSSTHTLSLFLFGYLVDLISMFQLSCQYIRSEGEMSCGEVCAEDCFVLEVPTRKCAFIGIYTCVQYLPERQLGERPERLSLNCAQVPGSVCIWVQVQSALLASVRRTVCPAT
jgi:hypothetical protein